MEIFNLNNPNVIHKLTMSNDFDYPLEFELNMSLGQSYLVGKAIIKNKKYTLNIQGGKTGILLPKEFIKYDNIIANFYTEKRKEYYVLFANVSQGRDWIEIYNDYLLNVLANDFPVSLIIDRNQLKKHGI